MRISACGMRTGRVASAAGAAKDLSAAISRQPMAAAAAMKRLRLQPPGEPEPDSGNCLPIGRVCFFVGRSSAIKSFEMTQDYI